MKEIIKIVCENDNSEISIQKGSTLDDVLNILHLTNNHKFIAAYVNNELRELDFELYKPKSIRFIDLTHFEGMRVYQRTLFFVLLKAVKDLYPHGTLKIEHSVARGFYGSIGGVGTLDQTMILALKERMNQIIKQNIPIVREELPMNEAIRIFEENGFHDKAMLLETRPYLYTSLYRLADIPGNFYGVLAPTTGYVTLFDLDLYDKGFYLAVPKRSDPSVLEEIIPHEKMFEVFSLYHQWMKIINISNIGALNQLIMGGDSSDLIKMGEAFQTKFFGRLADKIHARHESGHLKLVLISGPSSSGKTSSCKRLGIQLRVLGLQPLMLSMDDYFVDRDRTPLDQKGRPDYEAIEAVDVNLLNENLLALFNGQEVKIPKFDFLEGRRFYDGQTLKMSEKTVIIIEGIHGLNPKLTPLIGDNLKFKIYVSALTSIALDNTSRIHTTDNRLLRRMVRDSKYRNRTALETLKNWGSVRRGEEEHIFPFQEQADVMFNSSLFFEISILKRYAEPLLLQVPNNVPEYGEARRLLNLLSYFVPVEDQEVPPTSIIREFIGGSSFVY